MSVADEAKKIVMKLTGMWWPDADEGGLRDAATAWRTFADDIETLTAAANTTARTLIENNTGKAISAFDDPFWRRYYYGNRGWLQDMIDGARDLATALDQYADSVHSAVKQLEHELEIVGGTIVAGTALAFFTFGISEGAAAAATTEVLDLSAALGVTVTADVAAIIGTTLATAAIAGVESITVDLAVTQPIAMATGESSGLNLDEATDAALYGAVFGGGVGAAGSTIKAVAQNGGLQGLLDSLHLPDFQPGLALPSGPSAGLDDLGMVMRTGEGGGAGPGKGPWPVSESVIGPAKGKSLRLPNKRHTISGSASGNIDTKNTVILRGYEQQVNQDIAEIAAGRAVFREKANLYEINGRTYRVKNTGTVFPCSGTGLVELDRNEYAALQQIAKAKGNAESVQAFVRDPRFINNPDAILKAQAVYDGTY
ncbi:WXG100-like domain-containing protein [Actinacidiphila bryophytorum]|uniref:WXG100-like domain-containing protein n=1 Tax=Actinacidiphila bryophytorum TaxID=1436133 RepID=UPI002176ABFD|nr:hypothetical protein [Actinacidiphila bryophytorum]UWE13329.1 hypothetical protein NYE86_34745 [Actinacidiphila bryophytorum]